MEPPWAKTETAVAQSTVKQARKSLAAGTADLREKSSAFTGSSNSLLYIEPETGGKSCMKWCRPGRGGPETWTKIADKSVRATQAVRRDRFNGC